MLWAGVPVVTTLNNLRFVVYPSAEPWLTTCDIRFSTRVAASLLHALDLSELVATDWDHYQQLAVRALYACNSLIRMSCDCNFQVRVASDAAYYTDLRARLETNRFTAPAFDTELWVRNLEVGLKEVWRLHEGLRCPITSELTDQSQMELGRKTWTFANCSTKRRSRHLASVVFLPALIMLSL